MDQSEYCSNNLSEKKGIEALDKAVVNATNFSGDKYPTEYHARIISIVTSILLLMVTGIYSWFSYGQWDASRRATELAEKSVKLSLLNSRLDQRAWVGVTGVVGSPSVGDPFLLSVRIQNTGKTPAINVHAAVLIQDFREGGEPNINWKDEPSNEVKGESVSIISPNAVEEVKGNVTDVRADRAVAQSDLDRWKSGKSVLFIVCIVNYDDIFGVHHWLTYCDSLDPESLNFVHFRKNNKTDDNGNNP